MGTRHLHILDSHRPFICRVLRVHSFSQKSRAFYQNSRLFLSWSSFSRLKKKRGIPSIIGPLICCSLFSVYIVERKSA